MRLINRLAAAMCLAAMPLTLQAATSPDPTEVLKLSQLYGQLDGAGDMTIAQNVLRGYMDLAGSATTPAARNAALYGGLMSAIRLLRLGAENKQESIAVALIKRADDPVGKVEAMQNRPAYFDHALYVWYKILGDAKNDRIALDRAEKFLTSAIAADPEYRRLRDGPPPVAPKPVDPKPVERENEQDSVVIRTPTPVQRDADRKLPPNVLDATTVRRVRAHPRWATRPVNVRTLPSLKGQVLVTLQPGDRVRVTGLVRNSVWVRVNLRGRTAFVHGGLLTDKNPRKPTPIPQDEQKPVAGGQQADPDRGADGLDNTKVTQPKPATSTKFCKNLARARTYNNRIYGHLVVGGACQKGETFKSTAKYRRTNKLPAYCGGNIVSWVQNCQTGSFYWIAARDLTGQPFGDGSGGTTRSNVRQDGSQRGQ